ncbi:hypothetical protein EV715DRAFT_276572 [Schizophyllum commune]
MTDASPADLRRGNGRSSLTLVGPFCPRTPFLSLARSAFLAALTFLIAAFALAVFNSAARSSDLFLSFSAFLFASSARHRRFASALTSISRTVSRSSCTMVTCAAVWPNMEKVQETKLRTRRHGSERTNENIVGIVES